MLASSDVCPACASEMLSAFYAGIKDGSASLTSPDSDPEEAAAYFRSLLPLCRHARITRIADLTGLDRIGLPIIQAIRPAALSEVTSLGRGMSKASAAVGAIMESLERFYAEAILPPVSSCRPQKGWGSALNLSMVSAFMLPAQIGMTTRSPGSWALIWQQALPRPFRLNSCIRSTPIRHHRVTASFCAARQALHATGQTSAPCGTDSWSA